MKCYIYFIINKVTNERYVGQTTNFSRRKNEHLLKLSENRHPNPKLQAAYNYYKSENFYFEKITYENLTKEELDNMEIYYIKYYDSFGEHGYNLTEGGTGGDTRSKLTFDQFCFAYFGNKKYKGMTNRTGEFLGVDSSCISAIVRDKSYDTFREQALQLAPEIKDTFIEDFEQKMDIKNNPPKAKRNSPNDEDTLKIMCVASSYGRGIGQAILKHFNLTKGFIFHLMTGNGRTEIKEKYKNLSEQKILEIGEFYFKEWELQKYSKTKIKKKYTNLITKYAS